VAAATERIAAFFLAWSMFSSLVLRLALLSADLTFLLDVA